LWVKVEVHNHECKMQDYQLPSGERVHDIMCNSGMPRDEVPADYKQLRDEVTALRISLLNVCKGYSFKCMLFGRFEPVGTPVFNW
jgi:hypothetical protein